VPSTLAKLKRNGKLVNYGGTAVISTKLTFKAGGSDVSGSQFVDKVMDAALENVRKNLIAKIEAVRCPEHGQGAEAIGKDPGGINFEVRGCCDKLLEEVKRRIGNQ
jgi:hypothetical protein